MVPDRHPKRRNIPRLKIAITFMPLYPISGQALSGPSTVTLHRQKPLPLYHQTAGQQPQFTLSPVPPVLSLPLLQTLTKFSEKYCAVVLRTSIINKPDVSLCTVTLHGPSRSSQNRCLISSNIANENCGIYI
jgi:hypothetical protein